MGQKEKIAIIGANESILPLILKAKDIGYETHVFARKSGDIGEKEADYFYPIDVGDKQTILDMCKKIGVVGVCSITSDFAAPTVSYVSRGLHLPSNPPETDVLARDKYEMRLAFKNEHLFTPGFMKTKRKINQNELSLSYPLIVKPVDGWSSKGINKVDNFNELGNAIDEAINNSINKEVIIEEFVDGNEYSSECIVQNGEIFILSFTKKGTTGSPHFIETCHFEPSDLNPSQIKMITPIVKRAIKALHIENSAAHAEFRITKGGEVCFMEIGARMGGDCIGTYLVPLSTGIDYVKLVIDVAVGNKIEIPQKKIKKVAIQYILNKSDINKVKAINKENIVVYKIDEKSLKESNSILRHGYCIYYC